MFARRRKVQSVGVYAVLVVLLYWTLGRAGRSTDLWNAQARVGRASSSHAIGYRSAGDVVGRRGVHTQAVLKERVQRIVGGKRHLFPGDLASPSETLEILINYLASNPHTIVPSTILAGERKDHLDASQLLDFYTTDLTVLRYEIQEVLRRERHDHPVILLGHRPTTRYLQYKKILETMELTPPPLFLDLHGRSTDDILAPTVEALAGRGDFPMLLVDGRIIEGSQGIHDAFRDYKLPPLLEEYVDVGEMPDVDWVSQTLAQSVTQPLP